MKFRIVIAAMAAVVAIAAVGAADPTRIELEAASRTGVERLASLVTIEHLRHGVVEALATDDQLAELDRLGISWRPAAVVKTTAIEMCPAGWVEFDQRSWSCYPTYDQYVALLEKLAADHPDLCRLEHLGGTTNLINPHDLWALRISDNVDAEEDEPEVLLTSTMHGDEAVGFILLLRLADELLSGYGSDAEITELVDSVELWINPNANPDGTYHGGDLTVAGAIRYYTTASGNSSFMDPNRNFPDPVAGDHPDRGPWFVETEAMMALAERQSFVLSANFHGGAEVVNYPWDHTSRRHPDDVWLRTVSREYATLAQDASPGGYLTDLDNGTTHGWDWYPVEGGRQDFMTYFQAGREMTVELSAVKLVGSEWLDAHWTWNRASLYAYVGRSLDGVRGLVTDGNGSPLAARIEVVGRDVELERSWALTDADVGDYHRLLEPGTYTLRFSADGFRTQEIAGVAVSEGAATRLDVVLQSRSDRDLSGVVRWALTGEPAVGATVEAVGLGIGPVVVDVEGHYTLPSVPFGAVTVRFAAPGAETVEVDREISGDELDLDVALLRAGRQAGEPAEFKRWRP